MKRQNTVIYICVIITLLNVAGLLFLLPAKVIHRSQRLLLRFNPQLQVIIAMPICPRPWLLPERPYRCNARMYRKHFGKNWSSILIYIHIPFRFYKRLPGFPTDGTDFGKNGIPEDFKYGGHRKPSEPSGPITCRSSRVWQFLKGTGKENGLEINNGSRQALSHRKIDRSRCRLSQKT